MKEFNYNFRDWTWIFFLQQRTQPQIRKRQSKLAFLFGAAVKSEDVLEEHVKITDLKTVTSIDVSTRRREQTSVKSIENSTFLRRG